MLQKTLDDLLLVSWLCLSCRLSWYWFWRLCLCRCCSCLCCLSWFLTVYILFSSGWFLSACVGSDLCRSYWRCNFRLCWPLRNRSSHRHSWHLCRLNTSHKHRLFYFPWWVRCRCCSSCSSWVSSWTCRVHSSCICRSRGFWFFNSVSQCSDANSWLIHWRILSILKIGRPFEWWWRSDLAWPLCYDRIRWKFVSGLVFWWFCPVLEIRFIICASHFDFECVSVSFLTDFLFLK